MTNFVFGFASLPSTFYRFVLLAFVALVSQVGCFYLDAAESKSFGDKFKCYSTYEAVLITSYETRYDEKCYHHQVSHGHIQFLLSACAARFTICFPTPSGGC